MIRRYVGLLRAVNLGSYNQVSMAALREVLTGLGFTDARTWLQSGNVVFGCGKGSDSELERLLEKELQEQLGVSTDLFVRSAADWKKVVTGNPFAAEAERDPGHLIVMTLKERASPRRVQELQAAITGRERVRSGGRHLYIVYPDGVGRSRLSVALIEAKLGTRATGRNWNTVLKLAGLVAGVRPRVESGT